MPSPDDRFRYDGYAVDPMTGVVRCGYSTGTHTFTEQFSFGSGGAWDAPEVSAAVRLLFLLAGVSYYKTSAAPVIDLGDHGTTNRERDFLADYYRAGLGEFAYRNGLDLDGIAVTGPETGHADVVDYASTRSPGITPTHPSSSCTRRPGVSRRSKTRRRLPACRSGAWSGRWTHRCSAQRRSDS